MKQPFWIFNSILTLMLLLALVFVFFAKIKIPKKQSLEPYDISIEDKSASKVDLELIYKNDLFNTYQPAIIVPTPEEVVPTMPGAPSPVNPQIPETFAPQFFEPLGLTLTGIIVQEDETKNIAMIMNNKTQQQVNYRVGDEIDDAQIARILKDKIILIRSNGQQEILYLREQDSKEEDPLNKMHNVKDVVKKIDSFTYIVDPTRFVRHIKNSSQIIDKFDMSTAYRNGVNIGTKIGKIAPDSLASYMGLVPGDIIISINGIRINSIDDKKQAYKNITSSKENDIINIDLVRNNAIVNIAYKLKEIKLPRLKSLSSIAINNQLEKKDVDNLQDSKIKLLQEKYQFAPTIDELRARERQNMFKHKA